MKSKQIIRARGLTQREIAARAGISESRLSRILNGKFRSRASERRKISAILGPESHEMFRMTRKLRRTSAGRN